MQYDCTLQYPIGCTGECLGVKKYKECDKISNSSDVCACTYFIYIKSMWQNVTW